MSAKKTSTRGIIKKISGCCLEVLALKNDELYSGHSDLMIPPRRHVGYARVGALALYKSNGSTR